MAALSWNRDITQLVKEWTIFVQEDAYDAFEQAAVDVASEILGDTPLGLSKSEGGSRGTLKNNWQIKRQKNNTVLRTANPNKGRPFASKAITGRLRGRIGKNGVYVGQKSLYMFNNSEYAGIAEKGGYPKNPKKGTYWRKSKRWEIRSRGGYSKQAPRGFFNKNALKFNSFFKRRYSIV